MKSRRYRNEHGWNRLRDLLIENHSVPEMRLNPTVCDLEFWRYGVENDPDNVADIQLWENEDNKLIGFGWIDLESGKTDFVSHYQYRNVENDILEWSEEELRQKGKESNTVRYHSIQAFDCDYPRLRIVRTRDYEQTDEYAYYGRKILDGDIPSVSLPAGYYIRSVGGIEDAVEKAPITALAGGAVPRNNYTRMIKHVTTYHKDLDLSCYTSDGTIIASCTDWVDATNKIGLVEPYACDPRHRRKGVMKNLFYDVFRRLQNHNATEVYVSHFGMSKADHDRDPAILTNSSVGFESLSLNHLWKKSIM